MAASGGCAFPHLLDVHIPNGGGLMRVRMTPELFTLLDQYRIRSAQVGQRWRVGDILQIHPDAIIEKYCLLTEGKVLPGVVMSFSYTCSEFDIGMRVGRYTSIAEGVSAMGTPHPMTWVSSSPFCYFSNPRRPYAEFFEDQGVAEPELLNFNHGTRRIIIGHDVWVGAHATIKRGIEISQGAVIGARSVVTHNVPPYAVVAGVPARIIRYRFPEPLIQRLLALRWWRFTPDQLRPLDLMDPERFAGELEDRIAQGMKPPEMPKITGAMIAEAGERI